MSLNLLLLVAFSYLAGGVPGGLLICRLAHKPDPRTCGSGNIGATNVWRMAGRAAGAATLLIDMLKGMLPAALGLAWFGPAAAALAGLSAVAGHCWPPCLCFRGGKGVATLLGSLLIVSPWVGVCCGISILALGYFTGRMSVGSLAASFAAWLLLLFSGHPWPVVLCYLLAAGIVIWRHRENIARLKSGQEQAWR